MSDSNQVKQVKRRIIERMGRVNILVNCAGVSTVAELTEMSDDEWDLNLNLNAKGAFACSKYFPSSSSSLHTS